MIIGMDHIALSTRNAEEDVEALKPLGYHLKFLQRDVRNAPQKQPFLREFRPVHTIAYCRNGRGLAIELTEHGPHVYPGASRYGVYAFAGAPDLIRGVSLSTADPERSLRFWHDGLGLEPVRGEAAQPVIPERFAPFVPAALSADRVAAAGHRLAACAPAPAWCMELALVAADKEGEEPMLDDAGLTCLCLLSTSIERDLARAVRAGGTQATDVFPLQVNGRLLRVAMLRGTAGEIVELIQFAR
ncbi:MAG: VOC family protein [Chthonomonadales bacterium]